MVVVLWVPEEEGAGPGAGLQWTADIVGDGVSTKDEGAGVGELQEVLAVAGGDVDGYELLGGAAAGPE